MHMHNSFHRIFPSFTYHSSTTGPKSSRNTWGNAWSRISTGNVPVKTIGATISTGNGSSVSSTHSWRFSTAGNLASFHPYDIFNLCHKTKTNLFHYCKIAPTCTNMYRYVPICSNTCTICTNAV